MKAGQVDLGARASESCKCYSGGGCAKSLPICSRNDISDASTPTYQWFADRSLVTLHIRLCICFRASTFCNWSPLCSTTMMRSLPRAGTWLSSTLGRSQVRFLCSEQLPGVVTSATGGEIGIASGAPEEIYKRRVGISGLHASLVQRLWRDVSRCAMTVARFSSMRLHVQRGSRASPAPSTARARAQAGS